MARITKLAGINSGSEHNAALIEQNWHQNINAFSWTLVVHEL